MKLVKKSGSVRERKYVTGKVMNSLARLLFFTQLHSALILSRAIFASDNNSKLILKLFNAAQVTIK